MQLDMKSFKKFIKLTKSRTIYIVREMRIFEKKVQIFKKIT